MKLVLIGIYVFAVLAGLRLAWFSLHEPPDAHVQAYLEAMKLETIAVAH